jgi:thymidylate synthase
MENTLDKKYTDLLQDIIENGTTKETRNGGTISVFGRQIRHKMSEGFPLLTTKKMPFKTIVTELLWFLRGDTNIKFLVDNNCHIWDGDAYKNYSKWVDSENKKGSDDANALRKRGRLVKQYYVSKLSQEEFINKIKTDNEFAKKWGELGPIYGKQWRKWEGIAYHGDEAVSNYNDQIQNLINDLKRNPDSRRLMVNAWNVGELDQMVLPPCHYGFQVYTRELSLREKCDWLNKNYPMYELGEWAVEKILDSDYLKEVEFEYNIPKRAISLIWNQRSVDTFLGLPFNIASYGLLLEIIAKEVNMVPDELIGNLGDTHLYLNHIEQAREQIGREYSEEEMVEIYNQMENKKDRDGGPRGFWTWESRFEDNNIPKKTREPFPLSKVVITDSWKLSSKSTCFADTIEREMIKLVDYKSHTEIKAPLSN